MKKVIALLLALLLCFSLCACDNEEGADRDRESKKTKTEESSNPFAGTWKAYEEKQAESILEFSEEDGVLIGTWTLYDYYNETWSENSFKVKDQSDHMLTLLLDDGTMKAMPYTFLGHQLLLGDMLYSNEKRKGVGSADNLLIHNGTNVEIFDGIYIGAHLECLKATYPSLTLNEYSSASLSALYTYDNASFYFNDNQCLEYLRLTEYSVSQALVDQIVSDIEAKFGEYAFSERGFDEYSGDDYQEDIYTWFLESGTITVEVTTKRFETEPSWLYVYYR